MSLTVVENQVSEGRAPVDAHYDVVEAPEPAGIVATFLDAPDRG
jgi:hypothetical protein